MYLALFRPMTTEQIDRLTMYLISNGDVPAVTSQRIYEYAWGQGIRPLKESDLKPQGLVRRRRNRVIDREPERRGSCRGFSAIRAMKREAGREIDPELMAKQMARWNAGEL